MIPLAGNATWSRFAQEIAPHLNAEPHRFVESGAWFIGLYVCGSPRPDGRHLHYAVNVGDRLLPRAVDSMEAEMARMGAGR